MCLHYICYYCPIVGFLSYYKIFNKLIYTHNNNPKLGSIYFLSLLRVIRAEDYDNIYIGGVGEAIVATTASYEGLQGFSIWLSQSRLLHKVRIIIDGQVHIWRFSDTIDKER